MELYRKPAGVSTRWASFENLTAAKGAAAMANRGAKGRAFGPLAAGESQELVNIAGSGTVCRIWLTIADRSPEMLRSLRLDMYWDGAPTPAVSAPLGDFFGVALGMCTAWESALFSSPEGRSFNCSIPMPFRRAARITLTNESGTDLSHLYYDVDLLLGVEHPADALYFHTHWRRENPNELGRDLTLLPRVEGTGRFLGCNIGIITNPAYANSWWGEGEFKAWLDGDGEHPTLCGTGTEDYIGTAWGQGVFAHQAQGCLVADGENGRYCFYRYHLADPIYFDHDCRTALQTIGGAPIAEVLAMQEKGIPLVPVSVNEGAAFTALLTAPEPLDLASLAAEKLWCNFFRQDDWSATSYFYLDRPENGLPALAPVAARL